jgi:hypothetical protein
MVSKDVKLGDTVTLPLGGKGEVVALFGSQGNTHRVKVKRLDGRGYKYMKTSKY